LSVDFEVSLKQAVLEGDEIKAAEIAKEALGSGADPLALLQNGAVAGIREAGDIWHTGDYFLPDIILATEAYKEAAAMIEPLLAGAKILRRGKVLIGAVEGDAHDIGKSIVASMLKCASYEVVDLGVDVPLGEFVSKVREHSPDILGMGAYMTTTMRGMAEVMRLLEEAGLRDKVKVIVGGAAVTREYAGEIGADGYGEDAAAAIDLADKLMEVD
jgi:corrinoid protein of di/trimethylamine methyltransferase